MIKDESVRALGRLTSFLSSPASQQGLLLMAATTGGSFFNFLYHFVTGRLLGPADYAALTALIVVLNTVSAPMTLSQMLVSDVTARLLALNSLGQIKQLMRQMVAGLALLSGLIVAGIALASRAIGELMRLPSPLPVVILALAIGPVLILPSLTGGLQGWQDFRGMSLSALVAGAVRLAIGVGLVWIGLGVSGAIGGFFISGLVTVGLSWFLLTRRLRVPSEPLTVKLGALLRFSVQAALATLAFTLLTSIDVVFARRLFLPEQAGYYSAAATLGKVVLYLPGPVAMLMFPKSSARHALGLSRAAMLRKSALVTLGLSLGVTAIFFAWPPDIIRFLFGPEFAPAGQWLGTYGLAMSGAALVNLLMFHYLAAHDWRFVSIMLGFVVAQVVALTLSAPAPLFYIIVVAASNWGIVLASKVWLGGRLEPEPLPAQPTE